jgi:hypothetical protein
MDDNGHDDSTELLARNTAAAVGRLPDRGDECYNSRP